LFIGATSLILPWINRGNINELRGMLEYLRTKADRLEEEGAGTAVTNPIAARSIPPVKKEQSEAFVPIPAIAVKAAEENGFAAARAEPELRPASAAAQAETRTFEQQFGGRAFVWLGGAALALAGFFMVRYSIESGLLTEKVRVVLGLLFGFVLLGGSHIVRRHPRIADGTRISQALTWTTETILSGTFCRAMPNQKIKRAGNRMYQRLVATR
jgi:uncharacterized membrane protein